MKKKTALKWLLPPLLIGALLGVALHRWGKSSSHTEESARAVRSAQEGAGSRSVEKSTEGPPDTGADEVRAPAAGFDEQSVRSAPVSQGVAPETLPLNGKLAFNAERVRQVSSRAAGRLERIAVFEGAAVKVGEELAELYSPDYISAQNEYLLARNTARTLEALKSQNLLDDARATQQSARNRLKVLGAADEDIERLDESGVASTYLLIRAPADGVMVKRNVDPGAYLNVGDAFASIADPSSLWFYGNIYEADYSRVRIGQELVLESPALPGREFHGRLTYIAPSIDPATHTLAIRCEVPNPEGDLRPELFVTAKLLVGQKAALIAPKSALLQIKDASYVIVDRGGGLYQRVPVQAMALPGHRVAILSGVNGNERVLVEGAILVNELISRSKG